MGSEMCIRDRCSSSGPNKDFISASVSLEWTPQYSIPQEDGRLAPESLKDYCVILFGDDTQPLYPEPECAAALSHQSVMFTEASSVFPVLQEGGARGRPDACEMTSAFHVNETFLTSGEGPVIGDGGAATACTLLYVGHWQKNRSEGNDGNNFPGA